MNIIINCDDFGESEEINLNAKKLHELEILTSATILANGPFFENAVKIAKEYPKLGVGVHLTLDGNYNSSQLPSSLINPKTGYFYNKHHVIKKLKTFSYTSQHIFNEYDSQIKKVLDYGISFRPSSSFAFIFPITQTGNKSCKEI